MNDKFYELTVSPFLLTNFEQAWSNLPVIIFAKSLTYPASVNSATFLVFQYPPVTINLSPTSIPHE